MIFHGDHHEYSNEGGFYDCYVGDGGGEGSGSGCGGGGSGEGSGSGCGGDGSGNDSGSSSDGGVDVGGDYGYQHYDQPL